MYNQTEAGQYQLAEKLARIAWLIVERGKTDRERSDMAAIAAIAIGVQTVIEEELKRIIPQVEALNTAYVYGYKFVGMRY